MSGSFIFGEWWYGFFWDGGFHKFDYVAGGLETLLTDYTVQSIAIVIALSIAIICLGLWKHKWIGPVDRFAWLIVVTSISILVVDALVIYKRDAYLYKLLATIEQDSKTIESAFRFLDELSAPPKIENPIYFHYMDEPRIAGLYNQIEPELTEKQREVTGATTVKGKASLGTEGGGISVEGGSEKGQKTILTPTESSPERKCVGVMRYVRETWPENYFTNERDFIARRLSEASKQERERKRNEPITYKSLEALKLGSPEDLETKAETDKQMNSFRDQLGRELQSVHGLIFVDGDFTETDKNNQTLLV